MDGTGESVDTRHRLLQAVESASPVDAVEAVTRELRGALDASAVSFLIMDLAGRALVRLTNSTAGDGGRGSAARRGAPRARERNEILPLDGGPTERALRTQSLQVLPPGTPVASGSADGLWTVLAPVTERGETLGLLELSLPAEPGSEVLGEISRTAHVLGFVVLANGRHTDTFDYSLAHDVLHLSMTDAMGHGVASALTATLCVGSLRNTRRSGADLLEQARATNADLVEQVTRTADEGYATGLLGRLDLRTGVLSMVNGGNVPPYLTRNGSVTLLELPADLPFGLFADTEYVSTALQLQAGDRLVLVTDGMLERDATETDLPAAIVQSSTLHAREATRHLADRILQVTGHALRDDAALLVMDWHGDHGRRRDTSRGRTSATGAGELIAVSPRAISGPPGPDVAVPRTVTGLARGRRLRPVWRNELGGLTFEIGVDADRCFVKWAPAGSGLDLSKEAVRLSWAGAFARVPRLLDRGEDDCGSWLLTAPVAGRSAVDPRWIAAPRTAVVAVGEGLRALHEALPVAQCPFSWSVEDRLAEQSLRHLEAAPPVDRLVVCHGDSCAPNTLLTDDGRWSGHVDLGSLGVADRWADLAVATWSTGWNYGPGWEGLLLDAYGVRPDPDRTQYYRRLWDVGP